MDAAKPETDLYTHTLANTSKPQELLQVILDVIRCTYEPEVFGSWSLNGNPSFICDALGDGPSKITYSSSVMKVADDFSCQYSQLIKPTLMDQGFSPASKSTAFVIVSSHRDNLSLSLIDSLAKVLGSETNVTNVHVGQCYDKTLTGVMKVSVMVVSKY
ncbi:hypothetical protein P4S73_29930 [Paraglaciecola sp. Hal342]|jgi:hypothetical protein|uniref:Uncharacterized protein n=1 Tax=Paraglaciecola chathamensis TaxID=368405 RepID=A0A8H9IDB2_9ALTE|nr:hypothetical protein [Paraglaciecola oceanifecundans]GGZ79532.1 hypothetical protein GCM10011274_41780 [Paraglaciecola oceanifecundans]